MNLAGLQKQLLAALLEKRDTPLADPRGLRVYANNYRGQLLGSLRETYERTALWLGNDIFEKHAHAFIHANPSMSWSLNGYGGGFPAFLADACVPGDPTAEIAWLDNALRDAFYGRDVAPLALHGLAIDDWERATFRFIPTLRFHPMHTNAPALWSALSAGRELPSASLLPEPVAVRVWRSDLTPRFTSMPVLETDCLDLAMAGGTFGEICTLLGEREPEAEITTLAGQLLREWFTDGMIAGIT